MRILLKVRVFRRERPLRLLDMSSTRSRDSNQLCSSLRSLGRLWHRSFPPYWQTDGSPIGGHRGGGRPRTPATAHPPEPGARHRVNDNLCWSVQHLHGNILVNWSERLSSGGGGMLLDAPNKDTKGIAVIVKAAITRMTNDRSLGHKRTLVIHTYELRLSIYRDGEEEISLRALTPAPPLPPPMLLSDRHLSAPQPHPTHAAGQALDRIRRGIDQSDAAK